MITKENNIDFILRFGNIKINVKDIDLYSLISTNYSPTSMTSKIIINNTEYSFKASKDNNGKGFNIALFKNSYFIINPSLFFFKNNNNIKPHYILCYEYLIFLLKKYNYIKPYLRKKNIKIYINMDDNMNADAIRSHMVTLVDIPEKTIYDEYNNLYNFILTEKQFNDNESIKVNITNMNLKSNSFGKYINDYINDAYEINEFFFKNGHSRIFGAIYHSVFDEPFNFLTGPNKIGKTFFTLNYIRFDNFYIYINYKRLYELGQANNYEQIKNIFFYEISRYFFKYMDYKNFCQIFIENNEFINHNSFDLKQLIINFIESIQSIIKNNNNNYKKLKIILDEFELDQSNEKQFKENHDFLNQLYHHENIDKSLIHFLIISPINDNYIKKCYILGLRLFYKEEPTGGPIYEIDKKTNITYYSYEYCPNFSFVHDNELEEYKTELKKKYFNNIPNKYLELFNYSLYHINKIKSIYENIVDNNEKEKQSNEYIKEMEVIGDNIALSFYEDNNKLYKYDLDKVKHYNELINQEIDLDTLMDMLLFIPMNLISIEEDHTLRKYKISFLYKIYENSISKYLNMYTFPGYLENKIYKPRRKGDILELKVIEAIKDGYFKNFKPDYKIEINAIFDLTKKKVSQETINSFNKYKNSKLLMITQSNPYAKRYDIGFLQRINKKSYQFILGQITQGKKLEDMLQYKEVRQDCLDISNFFGRDDININVAYYHFIFIFKGGYKENHGSMEFCAKNNIKFIKFLLKNKMPLFSNSDNYIINDLVFNNKSYSLVDQIISNNPEIKDDSSSDYSLLGKKRYNVSKRSQAQYFYGIDIYNKIKAIIGKDFELSEECYVAEENVYFYIYQKVSDGGRKLYYLYYILNKKKIVVDLINQKKKLNKKQKIEYDKELKAIIEKPGLTFNCLKIINN